MVGDKYKKYYQAEKIWWHKMLDRRIKLGTHVSKYVYFQDAYKAENATKF